MLLGFGTIGSCLLPIFREALALAPDRYIVVDGEDHGTVFEPHRAVGIRYIVARLTAKNIDALLEPLIGDGDILVNVTMGVDSVTVADWCQRHGVCYIDSSVEPWDENIFDASLPTHARTEYAYHQRARGHAADHWHDHGPTAVFCHGANPGLVTHFVRAALRDIAAATGLDATTPRTREDWARLAQKTNTRVIHISERDTQYARDGRRPGEFVNTWSIGGLVEEASMPVEIGWGTHERQLPPGARYHETGPRSAIYASGPAARVQLRSWVPLGGQITGLALPHSESITISEYLTLGRPGALTYRPTVIFVYLPCDAALASLHVTMMRDWVLPAQQRIIATDVVAGRDELGVLLMGHPLGAWWYGSQLDIDAARALVPTSNPTAIQVAAGLLGATAWVAGNPREGYCEPEDLPSDEILEIARPWLGPMVSMASDWTPLSGRCSMFDNPFEMPDDPWQFGNFIVSWPYS